MVWELSVYFISLKKREYANKRGVDYTVIIGQNEAESGLVKLKNMETGDETEVKLEELEVKLAGV